MISFRYHVASLIAIFLALGIGILIGNSFVGLASISSQTPLLRRLESRVADVSQKIQESQRENASLRQRVSDRDRALQSLAPWAVRDLLTDRRVAVVLVGRPNSPETVTDLVSILTTAGATVTSVTSMTRRWLPANPASRTRILSRLQADPDADETAAATRALAQAIVTGNWSAAIRESAAEAPNISVNGSYSQPVGSVILITETAETEDALTVQSGDRSIERLLIDTWRGMGLRIVAAETEAAEVSLIAFYRSQSIPTIDNIDTPTGRIACALTLALGDGHYGVKPTADRLLPERSP